MPMLRAIAPGQAFAAGDVILKRATFGSGRWTQKLLLNQQISVCK